MTKDFGISEVRLPSESALPVLQKAQSHDGIAALSEQFLLGLDDARLNHTHFLATSEGEDVGLAALAPDGSAELVVDPDARRRGVGTALVKAVRGTTPTAGFWAHGDLPPARGLASTLGLTPGRDLLVMTIDGDDLAAAATVSIPDGFEAMGYPDAVERWGRERVEQAWLTANNEAFDWHPEQGGWDMERLHRGMDAEWFDPAGVRFLYEGENLAGFHWTKRHDDGVGEVYVVGLSSAYRRKGLGDPLVRLGLSYLQQCGVKKVKLYVEADNSPAVERYRILGFSTAEHHVVYA